MRVGENGNRREAHLVSAPRNAAPGGTAATTMRDELQRASLKAGEKTGVQNGKDTENLAYGSAICSFPRPLLYLSCGVCTAAGPGTSSVQSNSDCECGRTRPAFLPQPPRRP